MTIDDIFSYIDTRVSASVSEVASALELPRNIVVANLKTLLDSGRIVHAERDDESVPRYSVAYKSPLAHVDLTNDTYTVGYAHGYNAAEKKHYNDAFRAGQRDIINRLPELAITLLR